MQKVECGFVIPVTLALVAARKRIEQGWGHEPWKCEEMPELAPPAGAKISLNQALLHAADDIVKKIDDTLKTIGVQRTWAHVAANLSHEAQCEVGFTLKNMGHRTWFLKSDEVIDRFNRAPTTNTESVLVVLDATIARLSPLSGGSGQVAGLPAMA